jgi:hypothetical protein
VVRPGLRLAYTTTGRLGEPIEVGPTPDGVRRVVPILGGTVDGPLIHGAVLPGASDWQVTRADGVIGVDATYAIRTQDGVLLQVRNTGLRHGEPEVMAALARGEDVDPLDYYFRTAPVITAPEGAYEWVNRSLFLASGSRGATGIELSVWAVT